MRQETGKGRPPVGQRGSGVPPWPLRRLGGAQVVSGEVVAGRDGEVIDVDADPPPPSAVTSSITPHRGPQDGCDRVCFR